MKYKKKKLSTSLLFRRTVSTGIFRPYLEEMVLQSRSVGAAVTTQSTVGVGRTQYWSCHRLLARRAGPALTGRLWVVHATATVAGGAAWWLRESGRHVALHSRVVVSGFTSTVCTHAHQLDIVKYVKSFPSHNVHRAALISVSLALSQTPVYTARPRIRG